MGVFEDLSLWVDDGHGLTHIAQFDLTVLEDTGPLIALGPLDPSEVADTDGDGVGDNSDAFPLDATESEDSDGDFQRWRWRWRQYGWMSETTDVGDNTRTEPLILMVSFPLD